MPQHHGAPLFTPYALGGLQLRNRVVMASMMRGRARNAELAPTELHVEYYRRRATAGLILTEGTWISPHAIGFVNAPGLFTERQIEGWRAVPSQVHSEGGVAQSPRSLPIPGRFRISAFSMANCRPPRPR